MAAVEFPSLVYLVDFTRGFSHDLLVHPLRGRGTRKGQTEEQEEGFFHVYWLVIWCWMIW